MDTIRHSPGQFAIEKEEGLAVVDYRIEGDRMLMTHTFVPPELRGQKIAEQLVTAALEFARREHLRVMPVCSYVDVFLRRHHEFADLRAE